MSISPRALSSLLASLILLASPLALAGRDGGGGGGAPVGNDEPEESEAEDDDEENERRKGRDGKEGGEEEVEIRIVPTPLDYLETPCIEKKDANACYEAGLRFKQGVPGFKEGKPDLRRADNFLRTACYFGHGKGCLLAAKMHLGVEAGILIAGDGSIVLDYATAADLLDKGCRARNLESCALGGDLYFSPDSMLPNEATSYNRNFFQQDRIAARQLYEMGCPATWLPGGVDRVMLEGKPPVNARSCRRLGELFANGVTVRSEIGRAADYMELACMVDEGDEICDRAEVLREEAQEEEARRNTKRGPRNQGDFVGRGSGRGSGHLAPARIDTRRFEDDSTGTYERESHVRFGFELPIGVRWAYGPAMQPLFVIGGAIDFWVRLFGVGIDFTYSTDDLFRESARDYGRVQVAILAKVGIPLATFTAPGAARETARLILVPSIGGIVGSRALAGAEQAAFMGGIVERIELRMQTPQRKGPRQWGGIRFEQQQSWVQFTHGGVEHASQVTFVAGFTFGGVGPEIPRRPARTGED